MVSCKDCVFAMCYDYERIQVIKAQGGKWRGGWEGKEGRVRDGR